MSQTAEERLKRKARKRRKLIERLRKAVRKDLETLERIIQAAGKRDRS